MKPIIKVENVSKQYRIGAIQPPYHTLREALSQAIKKPFAPPHRPQPTNGRIWALKDVSFEIQPGEIVGIIGANGAGKSTLLKILSRVTTPTKGRVELYGRIGSLLEVGTGFHPELTGRENVFLNGAILGMTRYEILRKFDEMVAFSEIARFIDTPVKWYSTGMYLRLAFAVAAHFEPEILVVDEVLAVGDVSFQAKCMKKMSDLRKDGRTILFVSHNMAAVTRLCERVISLAEGVIVSDGPTHVDGIQGEPASANADESEQSMEGAAIAASAPPIPSERLWRDPGAAPGNDIVRLSAVRVRDAEGEVVDSVDIRERVGIEMEFEVLQPDHVLVPNYHFINEDGAFVFATTDHDPAWRRRPRPVGRFTSTAWIPGNFLSEGRLKVDAAISTMVPVTIHLHEVGVVSFQVFDTVEGDSARGDYVGPFPGFVRPLLSWTTEFAPNVQEPVSTVSPTSLTI